MLEINFIALFKGDFTIIIFTDYAFDKNVKI